MWRRRRHRRVHEEDSDPSYPQGGWLPDAPPSALFIPGARLYNSYVEPPPSPTGAPRTGEQGADDGLNARTAFAAAGAGGDAPLRTSEVPSPHPGASVCGGEADVVVRDGEGSSDEDGSTDGSTQGDSGVAEVADERGGAGDCPCVGGGCAVTPTHLRDEHLLPGVHLPSVVAAAAASGSSPRSPSSWSTRSGRPSRAEVARLIQCLCTEVPDDEDYSFSYEAETVAKSASSRGGGGGGVERWSDDPEGGEGREKKERGGRRSLLTRFVSVVRCLLRRPAPRAHGDADEERRHERLKTEWEEEEEDDLAWDRPRQDDGAGGDGAAGEGGRDGRGRLARAVGGGRREEQTGLRVTG